MEFQRFIQKFENQSIDRAEIERKWRLLQEEMLLEDLRREALLTHLGNPAGKSQPCQTTYVDCWYVEDGYVV